MYAKWIRYVFPQSKYFLRNLIIVQIKIINLCSILLIYVVYGPGMYGHGARM